MSVRAAAGLLAGELRCHIDALPPHCHRVHPSLELPAPCRLCTARGPTSGCPRCPTRRTARSSPWIACGRWATSTQSRTTRPRFAWGRQTAPASLPARAMGQHSTVRAAATDQVTQCAMPHLTVCCMLRMLAPATAAAIGRGADQLHKRHHGGAQGCGAHPQQHHLQRRWVRPAVNLKLALPWPGCCLEPPLQCPLPKPPGCALLSIAACLALPCPPAWAAAGAAMMLNQGDEALFRKGDRHIW